MIIEKLDLKVFWYAHSLGRVVDLAITPTRLIYCLAILTLPIKS